MWAWLWRRFRRKAIMNEYRWWMSPVIEHYQHEPVMDRRATPAGPLDPV